MIVYVAKNLVNEKEYVGMTSSSLQKRIKKHEWSAAKGSPTIFHNAIRKYGIEAFCFSILSTHQTRAEMAEAEIATIKKRGTNYPKGYNITLGGDGFSGKHRAESVDLMRANTTRIHANRTPEERAEIGRKISLAKKGKPQPWAKENSKKLKGKKRSDDFKRKVSETMKAYALSVGSDEMARRASASKGKTRGPMKEETKAKLSAIHKARTPSGEEMAARGRKGAEARWGKKCS